MRTTTSPAQSKTTVDSRLHMRAVMATPRVWCQRVSTLRLGFLNQQDSHNILQARRLSFFIISSGNKMRDATRLLLANPFLSPSSKSRAEDNTERNCEK